MESGDTAGPRIRPGWAGPLDHRAAVPVHDEGPEPGLSGFGKPDRDPGTMLGRVCDRDGWCVRPDRTAQGPNPGHFAVFAALGPIGTGDRSRELDHDTSDHGADGRLLLSNQLRRDQRGISAQAARIQSRHPAVYFRTVRSRFRTDHRYATHGRCAELALGVHYRRDSRLHPGYADVLCAARCRYAKDLEQEHGEHRPLGGDFSQPQHRAVDGRAAVRDDGRVCAKRHGGPTTWWIICT